MQDWVIEIHTVDDLQDMTFGGRQSHILGTRECLLVGLCVCAWLSLHERVSWTHMKGVRNDANLGGCW